MVYVYTITNTITGKIYIGKSKNPKQRWAYHLWITKQGNKHPAFKYIHAAINKHGKNNFMMKIIRQFETEEDALQSEKILIAKLQSTDRICGYNLSEGGDGGRHSEETRQKMSDGRRSGKRNPMFGKRHSEKTRRKISEAKTGIPLNVHRTDTHKEAISIARRGSKNNFATLTEQSVNQMRSEAKKGTSQATLASKYNVSIPTVSRILRYLTWKNA